VIDKSFTLLLTLPLYQQMLHILHIWPTGHALSSV
jgi:hypothetical protein